MKSELEKQLTVASVLMNDDLTAGGLARIVSVSPSTLKRYVDDLRNMGAEIESVRSLGVWRYRLVNKDAVGLRVARWLELERERLLL